MGVKDFSYTLTGIYTELIISALCSLIIFFILIIEIRRVYRAYFMKAVLELANTSGSSNINSSPGQAGQPGHSGVKMQMSIDLDEQQSDITGTTTVTSTSPTSQSASTSTPSTNPTSVVSHPIISSLTLSIYILYFLKQILGFVNKMEYEFTGSCHANGTAGLAYLLAKCCLYLMFLYRLFVLYSHTLFQYNTKILTFFGFICIFCTLLIGIGNLFTKKTILLDIEGHTFCFLENHKMVVAGLLIFDLFMNGFCCYFFIRPIWWLNKIAQNENKKQMFALVVKYIILTTVTVATTIISLIFLMLFGLVSSFTGIDSVINSICVMFFYSNYDKYYQGICCGAQRCGSQIIHKCCVR